MGVLLQWLAALYIAMSICAFVTYSVDKSAAFEHKPRIPEPFLHLLGLLCGWPGAWLAQRVWRHKTVKRTFQISFWLTVVLNLVAVAALVYWVATRSSA